MYNKNIKTTPHKCYGTNKYVLDGERKYGAGKKYGKAFSSKRTAGEETFLNRERALKVKLKTRSNERLKFQKSES